MFVKEKILERMMKQAYKSTGLIVGAAGNYIVLAGNWWVINIAAEEMPNELKGEIVKYLSDVPQIGKYYRIQKDMEIQHMLDVSPVWNVRKRLAAEQEWKFTKLIRNGNTKVQRIMQSNITKDISYIDNIVYALISRSDLAEGETMPIYAKRADASYMFYWDSEIMTLGIASIVPHEEDDPWNRLTEVLKMTDLEEEIVM